MVRHKDLPLSIKVDMLRKGEEDSDLMRNYYHGNVVVFLLLHFKFVFILDLFV